MTYKGSTFQNVALLLLISYTYLQFPQRSCCPLGNKSWWLHICSIWVSLLLKSKKRSQRKNSQAALASGNTRGSCEHTFLENWSLVSTWVNHGGELCRNWPQDHQLSKYTTLCDWPVPKTGHHWNQSGNSVTKKLTTNHLLLLCTHLIFSHVYPIWLHLVNGTSINKGEASRDLENVQAEELALSPAAF